MLNMAEIGESIKTGEGHEMPCDLTYQEIVPSCGLTEDDKFHYLLIDLPDFRKDDIKLEVDNSGKLTVSGRRLLGQDKYIHFKKTFKLLKNSDIKKVSMKFNGEVLHVSVAKLTKESSNEHKYEAAASNGSQEGREEETKIRSGSCNGFKEENSEQKHDPEKETGNNAGDGSYLEEREKKPGKGGNVPKTVVEKLCGQKAVIITAILAFVLGVLVSRKAQQTHPK
ncbi:hypothetical protein Ancab_038925 [Ancistrocladus abbreviatus]